jgi:hypothetical protein
MINDKARLDLHGLRDRLIILQAVCASLVSLAVTVPPPLVDRLEVLAVEAQLSSEMAITELSAIVDALPAA